MPRIWRTLAHRRARLFAAHARIPFTALPPVKLTGSDVRMLNNEIELQNLRDLSRSAETDEYQ